MGEQFRIAEGRVVGGAETAATAQRAVPQTGSLRGTGLRKTYGQRQVLAGVDIAFRRGEIVGLLGASGSGKSTIFNLLSGLLRPDGGRILLDRHDITEAVVDVRARLGIGYVPQSPRLFEGLTVEQNLRIALEARDADARTIPASIATICRAMGLEPVSSNRLANLSGGQRRRVEIGFALCGQPRYLLLDEPFVGLDPIVSERLSNDIRKLARLGIGILLTDHKVREALKIVQRTYVIDNGAVIAAGASADIVRNRLVRRAFLGDRFSL